MSDIMQAIELEYEGRTYELTFTRAVAEKLDRAGITLDRIQDVRNGALIIFPALFSAAFTAKHPGLNSGRIQTIYDNITDRAELMGELIKMYTLTYNTLIDNPVAEGEEKKVTWKRV